MSKITFVAIFFAAITMSGCASQKNWGASGGSKSDGIVKLAYTYGQFEVPEVNNKQALEIARKRCEAWGYYNVEGFDFENSTCQQSNAYGCIKTLVTKEYQCLN
jgi:hypothetical protein